MKKSAFVKNGILSLEVLLCLIALFLVLFRHSVAGSEGENQALVQRDASYEVGVAAGEKDDTAEPFEIEELEEIVEPEETADPVNTEETEDANRYDSLDASDGNPEQSDIEDTEETSDFLILANKYHYISTDYMPDLDSVNGYQVDARIEEDLRAMLQAAKDDGISLRIVSAYRSKEKQERLFAKKISKYRGRGLNKSEAYEEASRSVAIPGTSEHQLGLALDILGSGYGALNEGFANTEAGAWLADNCAKYGFILRYPKDKEDITGIIYEPWHFRYVGNPHALTIMDEDLTLEEYLEE